VRGTTSRRSARLQETPLTIVLDVVLPIFGLLAFGYAATFTRCSARRRRARSRASCSTSRSGAAVPQHGDDRPARRHPLGYLGSFYGGTAVAFALGMAITRVAFGVNAYLFGVRYDAGQAETATAILLSSIFSVATLSAVLVWLDADAG
jgi:hypothetical protein